MAERYVKCQYCGQTVPFKERDTLAHEVKVSSKGKSVNQYWHHECYPKELEKREFLLNEQKQKDEMFETVKKIYKINFSPSKSWWEMIADLREGTNRYQKFWKKRYKQGVPFNVIREAFILSVADIEWARMAKNFKSLEQEMRYGLMIMQGKVNDAFRKMKTREQQSKMNEAMEVVHIEDMKDNREVSFKKTQQENRDYSYLLGDD
ncbi:hypothetical protein M5X00_26185 [Paenibacillus alvei]|uniref:hypothetical protein n=1 Tax=Paenibacillus alvei TaxID=44250 RepID=UPI0002894E00|nr:hypothetical protein [Paenibacillus alvei]EJW14111.1 hypothetical protein PAV_141p02170 [Paenibacillus alvei DSM 29]MCY9545128.1 hypothetical protein [Paenibacillus alvei]MCY9707740.1 hypothetical protein [Paenibacillus alvei]MCY9757721.1 hypothetical protein [Paenibacillus alvei]MEC0082747.1 hypothetical protein [Paenibacillus alvei]